MKRGVIILSEKIFTKYIKAILMILVIILLFIYAGYLLITHREHTSKKMDKLPFYIKLSSYPDNVNEEIKINYINKVKNYKMYNDKTYDYELSNSFPSIPKDLRRWEFHRYDDRNYVCYVLRPMIGQQIPFIWEVKKSNGGITIHWVNEMARNLLLIKGSSGKYMDKIRKMPDSKRKVVEFIMDRETWNKDQTFYKLSVGLASKKFKISEKKINEIMNDYFDD